MNLGLWFRERFTGRLGQDILKELDQLIAAIQTSWNVQHQTDGAHTQVTATSVRTQRLSFALNSGANRVGRLFVLDATGGAQGTPLDVAAGVQFVSIISPPNVSYNLYGIRQAGVQYGDLLFVRKDPASPQSIVVQDRVVASVPVGTEIVVSADASPSHPEYYLQEHGVWLPLIYSPGVGTDGVDGWAMFSTTSV